MSKLSRDWNTVLLKADLGIPSDRAMTSAERMRMFRARHPYGPGRSDYRSRFGRYLMEPSCEMELSENCTGPDGVLIPHHVYYLSCVACYGSEEANGHQRASCKEEGHIITVCEPCHRTTHINSPRSGDAQHWSTDYRMEADVRAQDRHMDELGDQL